MTHAMPTCCQASTSTQPRGSVTLPRSIARPEGPSEPSCPPSAGGRMTIGNDMCFFVWVAPPGAPTCTFPLMCRPRRANAVQELLPKQIMRWSARM